MKHLALVTLMMIAPLSHSETPADVEPNSITVAGATAIPGKLRPYCPACEAFAKSQVALTTLSPSTSLSAVNAVFNPGQPGGKDATDLIAQETQSIPEVTPIRAIASQSETP